MSGQHQFGLSRGVVNVKWCQRPDPPICPGHILWGESNILVQVHTTARCLQQETWLLSAHLVQCGQICSKQAALNSHNRVTDVAKSGLTGKGPLAGCVMSHFSASQFPAIGWAVAILKTSCEDVLLTQVETRQRNDQTLQTPDMNVCSKKWHVKHFWVFCHATICHCTIF